MAGAHRTSSTTTRTLRRAALSGATLTAGSIAALGITGGIAGAATTTTSHTTGTGDSATVTGDSATGPTSSLVNVSGNQTPIQACGDQVPVNAGGVQVPVQGVTGALGITGLHSKAKTPAGSDGSCDLVAAQHTSGSGGGHGKHHHHRHHEGGSTPPPSSGPTGGGHGPRHHHRAPSSATSASPASSGAGQVPQVPEGSVNAGGGATSERAQPWQLGLGGAAVLAGAGLATTAGLRARRH
jgi:hypothetical protein